LTEEHIMSQEGLLQVSFPLPEISGNDLPPDLAEYLKRHQEEVDKRSDSGHVVPLYWMDQHGALGHIKDRFSTIKLSRGFRTEAPPKLYIGGVAVWVHTRHGLLATPDDRKNKLGFFPIKATAQGVAELGEAKDLMGTAYRELYEEAIIATIAEDDQRVEIVPGGAHPHGAIPALNIALTNHRHVGKLECLGVMARDDVKSLEMVCYWDLTQLGETRIMAIHSEDDWHHGGRPGINFLVLDPHTKNIVGIMSGQQGFIPFAQLRVEPTCPHL
jgi:hypothetical protein